MPEKYRYRLYKIHHSFPAYVEARDRLTPEAEAYADQVAGFRPHPQGGAQSFAGRTEIQKWGDLWSLVFHRKMNELAIMSGLCSEHTETAKRGNL